MKSNLSPLTDRVSGIPSKKWYEQEEKRDIFFPFPLNTVRDQMISTLSSGRIGEKSFWKRTTRCTGNITDSFLDMSVSIPAGRSRLGYHVFGELVSHSNGCLVQITIRDTNTFFTFLVSAAFITLMYLVKGVDFGIFAPVFFAGFLCLALLLQHALGVDAVTKAIRNSVVKPRLNRLEA